MPAPAAWGKDVERLARALLRQKLDPIYVRHYLMEQYQLDAATVERLLERIGGLKPPDPLRAPKAAERQQAQPKITKQGFY